MSKQTTGIKERIQAAKSSKDIDLLLAQGSKFGAASGATQRAWQRAAEIRRYQLASDVREK